jgi:GNAT superfamily N-acetyltransferase
METVAGHDAPESSAGSAAPAGPTGRRLVADVEPSLRGRLELGIAATREDLESCFALLHDAYVSSGFMEPHPSGIRVTPYHALPTTTTLFAKVEGQVVGTLSVVREGVFGLPMQAVFDITPVRSRQGRIAEISALAVHPDWRRSGGAILFPLMKFMHDYCLRRFDTRHLVIAVNPSHIDMYESILIFRRLTEKTVDRYDFVNGAPAVGATLDLHELPDLYKQAHGHRRGRRNLYEYFVHSELLEARFPPRPWHTTNDPVMTPELLDHFFNRRTQTFSELDERKRRLLHELYPEPQWAAVLPPLPSGAAMAHPLRTEPRYSMRCPGRMTPVGDEAAAAIDATVIEVSRHGLQALLSRSVPIGTRSRLRVELGNDTLSDVEVVAVRHAAAEDEAYFGFRVVRTDEAWLRCVRWLSGADDEASAPAATDAGRLAA